MIKTCKIHGETEFKLMGKTANARVRCKKCNVDAVTKRRRDMKVILVKEFGGKCKLCGYDKYIGSLAFHHLDPSTKNYHIGSRGLTRGIKRLREEVSKCILVCHNCHSEIHAGLHNLAALTSDS